ncbi:MAG: hypothetical protein R3C59_25930 [Planctomycetaceae bacterium]
MPENLRHRSVITAAETTGPAVPATPTSSVAFIPKVSKVSKRGLNRVAPKSDPESRKRREALQRLRESSRRNAESSSVTAAPKQRDVAKKSRRSHVGRIAPIVPAVTEHSRHDNDPAREPARQGHSTAEPKSRPKSHRTKTPKQSRKLPRKSGTVAPARARSHVISNDSDVAGSFQFDINAILAATIDVTPMASSAPVSLPGPQPAQQQKPPTVDRATAAKTATASDAAARPSRKPASSQPKTPKAAKASKAVKASKRQRQTSSVTVVAPSTPDCIQLVEPPPAHVETYREWFRREVVRSRWMMWFTTFYLHWLILLLLAVLIVHAPENATALLINATFAATEEIEAPPFQIDTVEPEPQEVSEPDPAPSPAEEAPAELEERAVDIADSILKDLATTGTEPTGDTAVTDSSSADNASTSNQQTTHVDTSPAQAVREGSFSVWTEPANPRPGEPYRIIIQVRLPEHIKTYSVTDLQGVVVGSDGYRKPIPGFMQGKLPIVDGYARLAVPIVSADKQVRDTVYIRSKLLKETQKLLIEFL